MLADAFPVFPIESQGSLTPLAPRPGWQPLLDDAMREGFALAAETRRAVRAKALGEALAAQPNADYLAVQIRSKEKFGFLDISPQWMGLPKRYSGDESIESLMLFWMDPASMNELHRQMGGEEAADALALPFSKARFLSSAVCADCAAPARTEIFGGFHLTVCQACKERLESLTPIQRLELPQTPAAVRHTPFLRALFEIDWIASKRLQARAREVVPALDAAKSGLAQGQPSPLLVSQISDFFYRLQLGRSPLNGFEPLSPGPDLLLSDPFVLRAQANARAVASAADSPAVGIDADLGLGFRAAAFCSTRYSFELCEALGCAFDIADARGDTAQATLAWRARGGAFGSLLEARMLSGAVSMGEQTADASRDENGDGDCMKTPPRPASRI